MNEKIRSIAKAVTLMEQHLRTELLYENGVLQKQKLWEYNFIQYQIKRREADDCFSVRDHIRAMVYSMLSSGSSWDRVEQGIDLQTGRILPVDDAFCQYDPQYILGHTPEQLRDSVKAIGCASQYTLKQMRALIYDNIPKLLAIEKRYGSVDGYYQQYIKADTTLKNLVKALSSPGSEDKLSQMGEALTAEYLRNVGYDIAKPDRHIRRILGSGIFGCSVKEIASVREAFDIVAEIARFMQKPIAEVDYILWSYCAKGYGEICTRKSPKCDICTAKDICNKNKGE